MRRQKTNDLHRIDLTAWRESDGARVLWIAAASGVDLRLIVEAACDCAEVALQHVPAGENRPRIAIETARAWCRGDATDAEVGRASKAAHNAFREASGSAGDAAAAASYAAYCVISDTLAASAADALSFASRAAARADTIATKDKARGEYLQRSANLVRARIQLEVVAAALAAKVTP